MEAFLVTESKTIIKYDGRRTGGCRRKEDKIKEISSSQRENEETIKRRKTKERKRRNSKTFTTTNGNEKNRCET